MVGLESIQNKYLDGRRVANCSQETMSGVDEEIRVTLEACYKQAVSILTENREALDKIAEFLLEKETITGKEFMSILKSVNEPEEENALREQKEASVEEETEK